MAKFKELLNKFEQHEENLKLLGDEIVKRYPQSKRLVELSKELSTAVDALSELKTKLDEAINLAEQESALKLDLMDQINAAPLYSSLSDYEKDTLVEFLIANEGGVASEEELLSFIKDSYSKKEDSELIAEFPKKEILDLGRSTGPEMDEFEAYQTGLKILQDQLSGPESKQEIINDLASIVFKEAPGQVIRSFYAKAFEKDPTSK